jgi:hypothetical protein
MQRKHRHLYSLGLEPPELEEMLQLGVQTGHFMTAMKEPALPELKIMGDETVLENHCGSYIRLSRDNLGHAAHGKGGSGGTDCAAIYMCAGVLSGAGDKRKKSKGEKIKTGPNTALDGASLYLTQRGFVDEYFALPKGKHRQSDNLSGAVLKSDHTRVIGRESVKIYAGKGYYQGTGPFGEPNSQGGDIMHQSSIDLIVGSADELQPVVKGDNLRECLISILDLVKSLMGVLTVHHKQLASLSAALISLPTPNIWLPAFDTCLEEVMQSIERILGGYRAQMIEINYLGLGDKDDIVLKGGKELLTGDSKHILSDHVFTT